MRILGIDPGLTRCGAGVITITQTRSLQFEHVEVLQSSPDDPLPTRLATLGNSLATLMTDGNIDAVALERVFAQQNLPSVMGVAQISGIVLYLAENAGIPVIQYTPNEVKSRVTGYGAADKAQVTSMVMRHLGLQRAPTPADAADALALAITHALAVRSSATHQASAQQHGARTVAALTPAQQAWQAAERATKRR